MSVYTKVDNQQLEQFLRRYDIGKALALEPVAAGITNSNYLLDTDQGHYVLTLYEHHSDDELDYILRLQRHLAQNGLRCSQPVSDRRGEFYSTLNQRPAAIIQRVGGEVRLHPDLQECALVGAELARFHLIGIGFDRYRGNPRGLDWIVAVGDMLAANLDDDDRKSIDASLKAAATCGLDSLPSGAIHADLFHDNVLFADGTLGGLLDFDYACFDSFIFDLAVLLNDWCIDAQLELIDDRVRAVIDAYQSQRPLEKSELAALPIMLRVAALRFWMSRLYDQTFPLSGELTFIKDPDEYRRMHQLRSASIHVPGIG